MQKIDFESQKLALFNCGMQNFGKFYENVLRAIFDQWPKLQFGFDAEPKIRILKVIYCEVHTYIIGSYTCLSIPFQRKKIT